MEDETNALIESVNSSIVLDKLLSKLGYVRQPVWNFDVLRLDLDILDSRVEGALVVGESTS